MVCECCYGKNEAFYRQMNCWIYFLICLSCALFGLSFAALNPLEYGIEFNANRQKLNVDHTYKGGRRYLGLGHRFITFPGRRILVAMTDDKVWHDHTDDGYIYVYEPVHCRSGDGLQLDFKVTMTMNIGRGPFENDDSGNIAKSQRESLERFFLMFGGNQEDELWINQIYLAALSSIEDEAAKHKADDFYLHRKLIGTYMKKQVAYTLRELEITLVDLNLVHMAFPKAYTEAIQDTELAKQDKETAVFAKEREILMAKTAVMTSTVFAAALDYTAVKTAEAELFEKAIEADTMREVVMVQGEAYEAAKEVVKEMITNSSMDLSSQGGEAYTADQMLTYVWMMSVMDADNTELMMDAAQPMEFEPELHSPDQEGFIITDEMRLASLAKLEEVNAEERAIDRQLENSEGVAPPGERL